jgi:hypothetical protein
MADRLELIRAPALSSPGRCSRGFLTKNNAGKEGILTRGVLWHRDDFKMAWDGGLTFLSFDGSERTLRSSSSSKKRS